MRWNGDAVADANARDIRPDFFDDTERLVADDDLRTVAKAPFVDVQVGSADSRGRYTYYCVRRLLQHGIFDGLNADIARRF
jgi:hypothetical protein